MTQDTRVSRQWAVLLAAGVVLLAAGAGGMYMFLRPAQGPQALPGRPDAPSERAPARPTVAEPPGSPVPAAVITLDADAVKRAGITTAPVAAGGAASGLRLPGVIAPNAYRQVAVTPLVAGRVTQVAVELGQAVRRGETMARVFSPELSEAFTRYTSARAGLAAHDLELQRTEKLVKIGAASRQELERIHAEHTAKTAEVRTARARLELLGVPGASLDGESPPEAGVSARVPAPIDGVVTERLANVGLNVDPSTTLFTVVDLSTVWVVADVYEKDFAQVRVGSPATVTVAAYPELALKGRISYIDPRLNLETRTAQVRVEVPNPRNDLRLGMYADVVIAQAAASTRLVIPRSAVQHVGDRQVVYLANAGTPGTFTEREVRLAPASGDRVEVLSGLQPGDVVVTEGSFFVRAERDRLGPRPSAAAGAGSPADTPAAGGAGRTEVQTAKIRVGEAGFEPARLTLRAGVPARLTFVRTTDNTCATEVVFPSLDVKRTLPLNQPVTVDLTPATGELTFACGMNMFRGTLVAQ